MNLAIFDLDNTLIAGDSDHAWGTFLISKGIVDATYYQKENDRYYEEYKNSTLDILAYQRFVLTPLTGLSQTELCELHQQFMATTIDPIRLIKAEQLIQSHKDQGDTLLVITATNRFITEPIVTSLGISHLLATDPEVVNGQFTGDIVGTPCFQGGKIIRLNTWLQEQKEQQHLTFDHTTFYSDSINDAPLLHHADTAIAVDPDERLHSLAQEQKWPIISLR